MIKFWAFVYRVTGWYSPWACKAELEFIHEIYRDKEGFGVSVGMWQVQNGFYRRYKG